MLLCMTKKFRKHLVITMHKRRNKTSKTKITKTEFTEKFKFNNIC